MSARPNSILCRYRYDPLDRLADCTPLAQARIQRFYLKERLTSEIQDSVQRSIFQQDDYLLAQQQRPSGAVETTLLATDQQRTVLHALAAAQSHAFAYTSYGHRPPENGLLSMLGFSGERPDLVTGHYLLGNGYRAFNPVLMRFNSPDKLSPFGKGGLNAYGYCAGDPINRVDPTGEFGIPLAPIQRALTIALHSIVPAGMIFGPKVSGASLWATRVSLGGSASSVVGAALQLTGNKFGPLVSAFGTTALVIGASVRGALAVRAAYQAGTLAKTVKTNVRNILGLSVPTDTPVSKILPKAILPIDTVTKSSTVLSSTDDLPQTAANIRESS
ncbi:RHS repeat-associated core domain-containing protein [Pseudomonas sp. NFIX10]|uniref:RHS repeat-associated core domain-containing protein n=1 Tax=unclassified Pseudomonas TaxID=196821 RepID=UPI0008E937AA|nr:MULTISPECIES: RHS repeat-associated core domain-containing protein [unclassified Pseudomonas]SFB32994.1 RHS repeat-associated core domain-containing protein [Pseudomonas sp. NFIX10]SFE99321.1 RHS repeat-associated core domain-containing protein [Pseudomonas sp. NFACC06-1]